MLTRTKLLKQRRYGSLEMSFTRRKNLLKQNRLIETRSTGGMWSIFHEFDKKTSPFWSHKSGITGFKTEEEQTKKTEMAGKIISNLSAIHFFEKNWATTVTCCNKVIDMRKTTDNIVKNINTVYLRLAEAQERQNNFDLSVQAIGIKITVFLSVTYAPRFH
jgi:hypothetical protein